MPAAVRETDVCSCGGTYITCSINVFVNYLSAQALLCSGCEPVCRPAEGSPNVFINGTPAHRLGDSCTMLIPPDCCSGVAASGSPNVFING